jgi:hypothetical protein
VNKRASENNNDGVQDINTQSDVSVKTRTTGGIIQITYALVANSA